MANNRIRGPLVTLAAAAALGGGLWFINVSQETSDTPQAKPVAQSTAVAAPVPPPPTAASPAPSPPPPAQFPAKASYVGKIPTKTGVITLEITVNGSKAVAYACDGNTVEVWLNGPASNGTVSLASKDKASRLQGKLQGNTIVGKLWIGDKKWDFTTAAAQPPAGLYVYESNGVRNSWIIEPSGAVTGVQRRSDGSTAPAPALGTDGTAVLDGQTVTATRVDGDEYVS
jgi:hypothetical protein